MPFPNAEVKVGSEAVNEDVDECEYGFRGTRMLKAERHGIFGLDIGIQDVEVRFPEEEMTTIGHPGAQEEA